MKQQGFTLIELVVVIVILGILAATAIPKFVDLKTTANQARVDAVSGALTSASTLNAAGCLVNSNVAAANKCIVMSAATTKCADIGTLMTPSITIVVGAIPNPTVQGTYYITTANNLSLTTTGVSCVLVMGDGSATGLTAAQNFTGIATGA